ncbi:hypothetical protein [Sphingomonas astaxanthinifaciens]|uniref:Lipoprotein n=1 Tax=Sphingomonas astaxanthinifaciens DSM 22298 TaxID=1123267 RepID=A0ABQ5ZAS5_9SPHN|nr:hypothetical protein [Sphingomonas astaxanthinifaciens]GLR47707.1 hypothetical protein GCM10007925_14200 [Sphingomonas astaxanthinifaciens DSM 22298]
MTRMPVLAAAVLALSACASTGGGGGFGSPYGLVRAGQTINTGSGAMSVTAPREWNRTQRSVLSDVRWVEDWTLNGPYLDTMSFVAGLPNDKRLIRQEYKADRQVPKFRSDMTAPEIAALLETLYRVEGGAVDFRTLGLAPRTFMGAAGFQLDYEHLDGDEVWRKGRAVGAVIEGKLYLVNVDAARSHYFAQVLPDFEAMVASARRRK